MAHGVGLPRGGVAPNGTASMTCSSSSSSHAPSAQARGSFPSSPRSPQTVGPFASNGPSGHRHH
eukprot:1991566-Pyramimonas_sp.AAC.1